MRLHIIQVVAALLAAIAFCLAFMTAGIALVSAGFMVAGMAGLGWLTWSIIQRLLRRDRRRPA